MKRYVVLFNPDELMAISFLPPDGVMYIGGGSTDRGEMAVYMVPTERLADFNDAISNCPAVIEAKDLEAWRAKPQ